MEKEQDHVQRHGGIRRSQDLTAQLRIRLHLHAPGRLGDGIDPFVNLVAVTAGGTTPLLDDRADIAQRLGRHRSADDAQFLEGGEGGRKRGERVGLGDQCGCKYLHEETCVDQSARKRVASGTIVKSAITRTDAGATTHREARRSSEG
ncbi:hypothetical protein D3C85_1268170 [compost metagenome]